MNMTKYAKYESINKYISLFVSTDIRIIINKYLMCYECEETFKDNNKCYDDYEP